MGYQPWDNPDPQATVGLSNQMVYGQNLSTTVGVLHQYVVGNYMQVTINPAALAMLGGKEATALSNFFGRAGLGGNMTFTLGTNTEINWGQQFEVNIGGETIKFEAEDSEASKILCGLVGAMGIIYTIGFGLSSDEDTRASWAISFQVITDLLLAALMLWQYYKVESDDEIAWGFKHLFDSALHPVITNKWQSRIGSVAAATGIIGGILFPLIVSAQEEGHFDAEQSSSSGNSNSNSNSNANSNSNSNANSNSNSSPSGG